MKKYLSFFCVAAMIAALAVSCSEKEDDNNKINPEDPASIQTEHLVAYFPFESDAKIMDFGAGITPKKSGNCTFVKGARGNAYQGASEGFSGIDCALGANNPFKTMSSFTFAMWIKSAHNYPGAPGLISLNAGDTGWGSLNFFMETGTESELKFKMYAHNTRTEWMGHWWEGIQNAAFSPNNWLHLVLSYDESESKFNIYANGVKVYDSGVRFGGPEVNGNQPKLGAFSFDSALSNMYLGAHFNNLTGTHSEDWRSAYPGLMDELRIYNVALTDAEVQKLFTNEVLASDGI